MTDKLLPCPSCGSKYAQVRYMGGKWQEPSAFDSGYRGECCDCGLITAAFDTETEAVAAWNTRAAIEYDDWFYLPKPKQNICSTTPPRVTSVTSKYGSYTVEAEQFIELNNRLTREWTRKVGDDIMRRICKVWLGYELTERTCHIEEFRPGWIMDDPFFCALSCGHYFDWCDEEPPNYCPNCGAKVVR